MLAGRSRTLPLARSRLLFRRDPLVPLGTLYLAQSAQHGQGGAVLLRTSGGEARGLGAGDGLAVPLTLSGTLPGVVRVVQHARLLLDERRESPTGDVSPEKLLALRLGELGDRNGAAAGIGFGAARRSAIGMRADGAACACHRGRRLDLHVAARHAANSPRHGEQGRVALVQHVRHGRRRHAREPLGFEARRHHNLDDAVLLLHEQIRHIPAA